MGGSHSKTDDGGDDGDCNLKGSSSSSSDQKMKSFLRSIKSNIDDEIARRAMAQREVQMAINIAQARDMIHVYGSAWGLLTTGVGMAKVIGNKPVPGIVYVPIVVGGFVLGNMADMAYGNKMSRVTKEAAHILQNERGRFYPVPTAPFAKFYTPEEKDALYGPATAVGDLFPNNILWSQYRKALPPRSDETTKPQEDL